MAHFIRIGCVGALALLIAPIGASGGWQARAAVKTEPNGFAEHQRQCAGKDGWSDPAPPVRIFANIYDVGTCGIVVLLVTGPKGNILIDAAPAEAAPAIMANIQRLGFRPADVKILLSSHEHIDHAGGFHALQRLTGAELLATGAERPALESGTAAPDDPQNGGLERFTGTRVARTLRDAEIVALGPLRLTAHTTPGHAPGSTSWSWRSCQGRVCRAIVYADSLSAVSSGNYRFADHPAYVATFKASMAKIARLPCDLLITPHPQASDLYGRLAGKAKLTDSKACIAYADANRKKLDQRLVPEAVAAKTAGR
ncbi:subclass B3 metallo-beta-lactamase BJP-1 [soil metagenome]